jgi:hypothetical protein
VNDQSREWAKTKREGPMILKFLMENKSNEVDLKVWVRVLPKEGRMANFEVSHSRKKVQLGKGVTRIAFTLFKIDPTKPFFEHPDDLHFDF